ncbi:hypothetical protein SLCG_1181 [Streptomyces lincolnensis]|nr:HEAT repeat domain-containing protein [Streptomyces lincolnensis]AXG52336.1 hypothetical protein SLCG_1181 [Streptomyces lincolnensis]
MSWYFAWEDSVFTGIDEVDWASLRHAHGSAEDVPGLLRGLASPDRTEREDALDRMYGVVHDQGTVYDSTLACVPFLLALAGSEEVPERGDIVELLVSIGVVGDRRNGEGPSRPGGAPSRAGALIRSRAEVFARLTGDADAEVRRTAVSALVRFLDEPTRVLGLLRERFTVERDDRVLLSLTQSLGLFVRRHPAHAAEALELLVAQSAPMYGPGLRLAALGQLADCAPDRLPPDLVPLVVRLLRQRSAARPAGREEAGTPGADTLVGRLERLRPSDEEGSWLLRTLHSALGDRVDDRIALLDGQLTGPDPADRCNGVWMAAGLLREWRIDHVRLVSLIGEQLAAEEGRLRDAAVSVLTDLFGLAAPAADRLATLVTARPELWVRRCEGRATALGGPLKALAGSGDPRAVPMLAEVLAGGAVPGELGQVIVPLGRAAAPLAPLVRQRLGAISVDSAAGRALAVPLLSAVVALGDREALPEVMRLVHGEAGLSPGEPYTGYAVRALGLFGSAAREAVPALRRLLDTGDAGAAARALWEVEEDASVVLPVLVRELADGEPRRRRQAAEVLARLGPQARPASAALRRGTTSDDPGERVAAAYALWRIDADAEPVLPVLRRAWSEAPSTRRAVAEQVVAMGRAATPLRDLVDAELSSRRRHLASPGAFGSHDILKDERLLGLCREVVAGG